MAITLVVLVGLASSELTAPPRYQLQLIPPPASPEGLAYSAPFRLGKQGEIAGYAAPEPYHPLAAAIVVDAAGKTAVLPAEDPSYNFAFGFAPGGGVLGQSGRRACLWEEGEQHFLKVLPTFFSGLATDANSSGLICGNIGDYDEIGSQHCVWPGAALDPVLLPGLFAENTTGTAWAVNEAGQVAGSSGGVEGGFIAARWDSLDGAPLPIGPLEGAFNSEARGLNELGDVVGRSSFASGETQAFIYESAEQRLTGLPFLPDGGGYSEAFDVNDARQAVGTARREAGRVHAVLWQDGVAHDLNDLAVIADPRVRYLSSAGAINNSGQIAVEAVIGEGEGSLPRWVALLSPLFIRADANADRLVDITDPIFTLAYKFLGGPAPGCLDAADANDDGKVDIADAVYTLARLFMGGPEIPPPSAEDGADPTPDELGCYSR
jgi:probable HAF family extracellular repeat protein